MKRACAHFNVYKSVTNSVELLEFVEGGVLRTLTLRYQPGVQQSTPDMRMSATPRSSASATTQSAHFGEGCMAETFRWASTSLNTLQVKCKKDKGYDSNENRNLHFAFIT